LDGYNNELLLQHIAIIALKYTKVAAYNFQIGIKIKTAKNDIRKHENHIHICTVTSKYSKQYLFKSFTMMFTKPPFVCLQPLSLLYQRQSFFVCIDDCINGLRVIGSHLYMT